MSNETLAKQALEAVRTKMQLKSTNKYYPQSHVKHTAHELRRKKADKALGELRSLGESVSISGYGALALESGAGNCFELACAAAAVITSQGGTAHVFETDDPGDHAFCVVGNISCQKVSFHDIASLGTDVWICDPWAKIASPAQTYIASFNSRMSTWESKGKRIFYKGGWKSPTDKTWTNSLKYVNKQKLEF